MARKRVAITDLPEALAGELTEEQQARIAGGSLGQLFTLTTETETSGASQPIDDSGRYRVRLPFDGSGT